MRDPGLEVSNKDSSVSTGSERFLRNHLSSLLLVCDPWPRYEGNH